MRSSRWAFCPSRRDQILWNTANALVFNPLKSMTVPVSNRNGERGSPARNDTESPLKLTRTPAANPQAGVARCTCPDSFDIEFWWVSNAD